MIHTIDLRVNPQTAATDALLAKECANSLGIKPDRIKHTIILRRSIDARQRRVMVNLRVSVHVDQIDESADTIESIVYPNVSNKPEVIIVGAGPAGLFAALELIELGLRPIILERGKDVDSRRVDMVAINRQGIVNPDSNYCFGEGGAGAYSDGKLYTRSKKRGPIEKVLRIFYQHGAQRRILIDAHPHIGSDRLPFVIKAMRETILASGGEVHFNTRVTNLIIEGQKVVGAIVATGKEWRGQVILATGHSARDVYSMLLDSNVSLEAKGLAVGVRLEHPQQLIDRLQYHSAEGRGKWLPAAEYSMLTRVDDRAVYSFCMCPGGYIIPAASAPGQLVVNGMSPADRGTRWANSGMVVEVLPDDIKTPEGKRPELRMMYFQEEIEKRFFDAAGQSQHAPAQRMTDFVAGRASRNLPRSSYPPGLLAARVDLLLPEPVSHRLREGFKVFDIKQKGFLTPEATVIGCETRTSSPVRIPRNEETLQHISVEGIYPCGEGAGYAGGIVSAAVDGIRSAQAVAAKYSL